MPYLISINIQNRTFNVYLSQKTEPKRFYWQNMGAVTERLNSLLSAMDWGYGRKIIIHLGSLFDICLLGKK